MREGSPPLLSVVEATANLPLPAKNRDSVADVDVRVSVVAFHYLDENIQPPYDSVFGADDVLRPQLVEVVLDHVADGLSRAWNVGDPGVDPAV